MSTKPLPPLWEAAIGGIWLGLYVDYTWELGNSSREVDETGIFVVKGDTLILTGQRTASSKKLIKEKMPVQDQAFSK